MIKTLISDQGTTMLSGFNSISPNINYRSCLWHLSMKCPKDCFENYWKCVLAKSQCEFNYYWKELKKRNSKFVNEYLEDFKNSIDPFSENYRHGILSSSSADSINSRIKENKNNLIDTIFKMLIFTQYNSFQILLHKNCNNKMIDQSYLLFKQNYDQIETLILKKYSNTNIYEITCNNRYDSKFYVSTITNIYS